MKRKNIKIKSALKHHEKGGWLFVSALQRFVKPDKKIFEVKEKTAFYAYDELFGSVGHEKLILSSLFIQIIKDHLKISTFYLSLILWSQ